MGLDSLRQMCAGKRGVKRRVKEGG